MTQPTCVFCDQPLTGRDLDAALPYETHHVCTVCHLQYSIPDEPPMLLSETPEHLWADRK